MFPPPLQQFLPDADEKWSLVPIGLGGPVLRSSAPSTGMCRLSRTVALPNTRVVSPYQATLSVFQLSQIIVNPNYTIRTNILGSFPPPAPSSRNCRKPSFIRTALRKALNCRHSHLYPRVLQQRPWPSNSWTRSAILPRGRLYASPLPAPRLHVMRNTRKETG